MEKGCKNLLMETFTKAYTLMENLQDMANIIGLMEATLKEYLKMA